jgi:hypothetical protein
MVASLYGWMRYSGVIATRTAQPNPDFTVVTVRRVPIPVPGPRVQQEPETITIDKMVVRP